MHRIIEGGNIRLLGVIWARGKVVADRTVTVWRRALPSGAWSQVATATYDSYTESYWAQCSVDGPSVFRLRFAGDDTYRASSSRVVRINVYERPAWMPEWFEDMFRVLGREGHDIEGDSERSSDARPRRPLPSQGDREGDRADRLAIDAAWRE